MASSLLNLETIPYTAPSVVYLMYTQTFNASRHDAPPAVHICRTPELHSHAPRTHRGTGFLDTTTVIKYQQPTVLVDVLGREEVDLRSSSPSGETSNSPSSERFSDVSGRYKRRCLRCPLKPGSRAYQGWFGHICMHARCHGSQYPSVTGALCRCYVVKPGKTDSAYSHHVPD